MFKRIRNSTLLPVVLGALILDFYMTQAVAVSDSNRRVTDPAGRILYQVQGTRVTDQAGRLLGTVENGEVRDSAGRLIARDGDAGLLYCH